MWAEHEIKQGLNILIIILSGGMLGILAQSSVNAKFKVQSFSASVLFAF